MVGRLPYGQGLFSSCRQQGKSGAVTGFGNPPSLWCASILGEQSLRINAASGSRRTARLRRRFSQQSLCGVGEAVGYARSQIFGGLTAALAIGVVILSSVASQSVCSSYLRNFSRKGQRPEKFEKDWRPAPFLIVETRVETRRATLAFLVSMVLKIGSLS